WGGWGWTCATASAPPAGSTRSRSSASSRRSTRPRAEPRPGLTPQDRRALGGDGLGREEAGLLGDVAAVGDRGLAGPGPRHVDLPELYHGALQPDRVVVAHVLDLAGRQAEEGQRAADLPAPSRHR